MTSRTSVHSRIGSAADLAPTASLALHFRFIARGEVVCGTSVAVRLLARALWAVKPYLAETGSLVIRMEKLFHTQDLGGSLEDGWRRSMRACHAWPGFDLQELHDLDRIFVIVLSGRLAGVAGAISRRITRPSHHSLLFGHLVDSENSSQRAVYLGSVCTPIGVLHTTGSLELAFSAIEYHPEIERMLNLVRVFATPSDAALATAQRLINMGEVQGGQQDTQVVKQTD